MNQGEFRGFGHRVVDLLADYLEHIEERPVFPNIEPSALTRLFAEPLPQDSSSTETVLGELEEKLFPYCTHVGHPGYMGLITPSPSPVGILADLICSALNQNVGAYTIGPAAVAMERRTVRWLTDLAGYGEGAGGNLTSGGMMANFVGLKLARDSVSGDQTQVALGGLRVGRTALFDRQVCRCRRTGANGATGAAHRRSVSRAAGCTGGGHRGGSPARYTAALHRGHIRNHQHRGDRSGTRASNYCGSRGDVAPHRRRIWRWHVAVACVAHAQPGFGSGGLDHHRSA